VDLRRPVHTQPNDDHPPTLAYVGKVGGWYATREMMRFVAVTREIIRDLRLRIWTQSDAAAVTAEVAAAAVSGETSVSTLPPEEIIPALRRNCDAALSFIRPCL